jgi:hypothetical protein
MNEASMEAVAIQPVSALGKYLPNNPLIKKPINGNNGISIPGKINNESCNSCSVTFV